MRSCGRQRHGSGMRQIQWRVLLNRKQMDIYVGNLPYSATEEEITDLFAPFGPVERVKIITDRETGRSKGFAFVTLGDQSQLNDAVDKLNGYEFNGRALRVNASEPKENKPYSGGGERRSGGYGERRGSGGGGYKGGDRRGGGGGYGDRRGGGGGYGRRRDNGGDSW